MLYDTPPPPPVRVPDVGLRLAMMLLDHVIFSALMAVFVMPFWFYWMFDAFGEINPASGELPAEFLGNLWIIGIPYIIAIALYLNKDALDGRSPGKRIIKARVINFTTRETAGPLRCFVRNLTLWLWPIEALLVLVSKDRRRIGDFLAGTQVVVREEGEPAGPVLWDKALLSLGAGIVLMTLVFLPFYFLFQKMSEKIPEFTPPAQQESSFQEAQRQELEALLGQALGDEAELEMIRVYERSGPVPSWFVILHLNVGEEYLDDDIYHNELRAIIRPVLEEQLNDLPVQGRMRLQSRGQFRSVML